MRNIIFWWFVIFILFISMLKSCNAQKDSFTGSNYIPVTEHQYGFNAINDTLILYLFRTSMSANNIKNSQDGRVLLKISIDSLGNITNINFDEIVRFELIESMKDLLLTKLQQQIKFDVSEDTRNYYAVLKKSITFYILIQGKGL